MNRVVVAFGWLADLARAVGPVNFALAALVVLVAMWVLKAADRALSIVTRALRLWRALTPGTRSVVVCGAALWLVWEWATVARVARLGFGVAACTWVGFWVSGVALADRYGLTGEAPWRGWQHYLRVKALERQGEAGLRFRCRHDRPLRAGAARAPV